MASIENREGKCSRTGCQLVQDNARAARCTGTEVARCTENSRTRNLRVQDAEIINILKVI